MRNGFLEGIDGAARIMNIYHGIRDRQDKRVEREEDKAYRTERDQRGDFVVDRAFENQKYEFGENKKYQYAALHENAQARKATNALGWANHNLNAAKYRDARAAEAKAEARSEAEANARANLFNMTSGFGGEIGKAVGVPDGASLNISGKPSGITDNDVMDLLGDTGRLVKGSGNTGAIIAKETGFTNAALGVDSDDVRLDALDRGDGKYSVTATIRNADGSLSHSTVPGGESLTADQLNAMFKNSGGVQAYLKDSQAAIDAQSTASARLTSGVQDSTKPKNDYYTAGVSGGFTETPKNLADLGSSATALAKVATGWSGAAAETATGLDQQRKTLQDGISLAQQRGAEQSRIRAENERQAHEQAIGSTISRLMDVARTGDETTAQQALLAAKAVSETGNPDVSAALAEQNRRDDIQTAQRKGEVAAAQKGAENRALQGMPISAKEKTQMSKDFINMTGAMVSDNKNTSYAKRMAAEIYHDVLNIRGDNTTYGAVMNPEMFDTISRNIAAAADMGIKDGKVAVFSATRGSIRVGNADDINGIAMMFDKLKQQGAGGIISNTETVLKIGDYMNDNNLPNTAEAYIQAAYDLNLIR